MVLFGFELCGQLFPCVAADARFFETADFVFGFGDDGGNGGRYSVIVNGNERHVCVANQFRLPRNLRMDSHDFYADFHGRVENAVYGCLDGEDCADSRWLEKAYVVN